MRLVVALVAGLTLAGSVRAALDIGERAPDGAIVFHYMSLNPTKHVEKMLGALKSWAARRP